MTDVLKSLIAATKPGVHAVGTGAQLGPNAEPGIPSSGALCLPCI
jgi:hypothetical protein